MADTDTEYKEKLRKTILTDAGRQVFLSVGNGVGTLVYTRATLSSKKPVDTNGTALDNEAVRKITSLPDDLKEGQLQLTPVTDNHFDVISDFSNKNQAQDISFSCIGWYARIDTTDSTGKKTQGDEVLIAITFTNDDHETLAAGSPDGLSTDVISAELDMTISDAANIDMTVNEIGYVTRAELNTWQTRIQDNINTEFDTQSKALTVTLNGKDPTKADDNHVINLPTYDRTTIDQMMASAGKGAGIHTVQGIAPNSNGEVDLTSVFYLKTDVDKIVTQQNNTINSLQTANGNKDTQIASLINQNTAQIKENTTDIQSVEGAGALTYVHVTDQSGNRITDQNGNELIAQKWLVIVDKTLTQSDLPADAKAVGDAIAKSNQFDVTKYDIPVLYLYGDRITSLKDKNGSLKNEVQYNFPKYHIKGTCTSFKVQGASSATLPKKNWTLNLDQSVEIFPKYGKQHKYVVKANMTDFSQSRNVVSAKIWGQVEKSRNKAEDILQDDQGNYMTDSSGNHISFTADPQLSIGGNYGAVDGFPIVIYVNDKYWGLYSFNIPKDDWMAKMPKKQGYAILDAVWSPQGGFNAETNLNDGLEVQFSGTKNTDWIKTSINKLIDVCLAHYDTKEAFDAAVSNLIDINNAIDYLLYSVFIDNDDGVFRNYLLQTFNGTKWYFAPYDLDMTYGRSPQTWRYLSPDDNGQNPYLNGVNLNSLAQNNRLFYQLIKFHKDDLIVRYKELASTSLSVSSLLDSFNKYLEGISKALTDQEVQTWPQTPETQTNNFSQIRWWYDHRINWLNQVFSTTDSKQA